MIALHDSDPYDAAGAAERDKLIAERFAIATVEQIQTNPITPAQVVFCPDVSWRGQYIPQVLECWVSWRPNTLDLDSIMSLSVPPDSVVIILREDKEWRVFRRWCEKCGVGISEIHIDL